MKKYLIIFLIFLLTLPVMSKTLTGGVVYTVESAREAAFDGIEYEISMEPFKKYLQDPGFISVAKKEGGRPKVSKRGRRVQFFSDGGYGIIYKNNAQFGFYYNKYGKLEMIEIYNIKRNKSYPYLSTKYNSSGVLLAVSLAVSKSESYIFDIHKKLTAHWINQYGYNEKGELEKTRY